MHTIKEKFDGLTTVVGIVECQRISEACHSIRLEEQVVALTKNLTAAELRAIFTFKCYTKFVHNSIIIQIVDLSPKIEIIAGKS